MLTGTRLLTSNGYRPVETLRRGDMVATLIGRGPMFVPIAWIGRRRPVSTNEGTRDGVPVRIRRHAIGDEMPNRDILLAPDHAIYLEGGLYLVRHLVNHATICLERGLHRVEYWGVRLERHDILAAQNMAVESLLPDSAALFVEVTAPHLTIVGAPLHDKIGEPDTAPLDFPARILMSARWVRRRLLARARTAVVPTSEMRTSAPPQHADGRLDVATEARTVMGLFAELATQRGVRMEIAIEPALMVRMEQRQFHELLGAVLTHAIHAGSGRVLLGAMRYAGRVQIAIIDEGSGNSREQQVADLRPAAQLAAMQGATLEVDARPGEGTTILLRILAPRQED
ncbi:MAG TPA: Hint domain-containing protein [Rhodocyclaceae bacterium]|nr:Hint domain-containing protein [Rhodocyclaceae bacterium]